MRFSDSASSQSGRRSCSKLSNVCNPKQRIRIETCKAAPALLRKMIVLGCELSTCSRQKYLRDSQAENTVRTPEVPETKSKNSKGESTNQLEQIRRKNRGLTDSKDSSPRVQFAKHEVAIVSFFEEEAHRSSQHRLLHSSNQRGIAKSERRRRKRDESKSDSVQVGYLSIEGNDAVWWNCFQLRIQQPVRERSFFPAHWEISAQLDSSSCFCSAPFNA